MQFGRCASVNVAAREIYARARDRVQICTSENCAVAFLVQLLNRHGVPVASRRIRIRKMDRCSCVSYCSCACVGDANGTGCQPMSPELYHDAGFRGAVPAIPPERGIFSNVAVDILLFFVSLILLLFIMGE